MDSLDKIYLAKANYWASQLPKRKPKKKVFLVSNIPPFSLKDNWVYRAFSGKDKTKWKTHKIKHPGLPSIDKYKRPPPFMNKILDIAFCKKINFYNKGEI